MLMLASTVLLQSSIKLAIIHTEIQRKNRQRKAYAFPIAADEEFPGHCFAEWGEREREAVEVVDARLWLCASSVYVEVVL